MTRRMLGMELNFISRILRDGSGTEKVESSLLAHLNNERFDVSCLSVTNGTYIAAGFNSFVVKLKEEKI